MRWGEVRWWEALMYVGQVARNSSLKAKCVVLIQGVVVNYFDQVSCPIVGMPGGWVRDHRALSNIQISLF